MSSRNTRFFASVPVIVGGLLVAMAVPAGAGSPNSTAPPLGPLNGGSAAPTPGPDFDGDGFEDLAVATRSEDLGAVENAGVVQVVYGSAAGLTSTGNQLWSQDSPGIPGEAAVTEYFGNVVAWGDFDGDGFDDIAIGLVNETSDASGVVHVLYGSPAGLVAEGNQLWSQSSPGVPDEPESGDLFGHALLGRDLDGDGADELVVGVPGEDRKGAVIVLKGSPGGLTGTGAQQWYQRKDKREDGDLFGISLAAGDLDGDGNVDLAVGASGDDYRRVDDAGAITVLYGTPTGLGAARAQTWFQPDTGLPAGGLEHARFGATMAIGSFNGDNQADLAVGLPDQKVSRKAGAGAVDVLYGGPDGLSAAGAQLWHQASPGVPEAPEPLDSFGTALAAGDFDDDGRDDLAIGVPRECADPCVSQSGAVSVLYGSPSGLSGSGSELWSQDSAGIDDTGELGDRFGQTLARADFDGDDVPDLAVGVWLEGVGAVSGAGAVAAIYAGAGGLVSDGNQLWTQDSPGILDAAEEQDEFSFGLTAQ